MNLIETLFYSKLKIQRIENYLAQKDFSAKKFEKSKDQVLNEIKISCVQRSIKPVTKIETYIDEMFSFIEQAALEKSQLVVFPEYNFFDLLGLIPGFNTLNNYLNKKALENKVLESKKLSKISDSGSGSDSGSLSHLNIVFRAMANPVQAAVELIFSELAKKSGLYIYTGSYLLKEGAALYNAGTLIDRKGKIIGTQKKIHLTDFEDELNFSRCSDLQIFELDFCKVAIPICMDATYWETFNIAKKKGADLVILPIANNEEYRHYKALRGIWPRVQESYLYGIKSSLNGWLGGLNFTGKAGIFAPLELTSRGNGVIVSAEHYTGDYLLSGSININKLEEARQKAEYFDDTNPAFENKLTTLYTAH